MLKHLQDFFVNFTNVNDLARAKYLEHDFHLSAVCCDSPDVLVLVGEDEPGGEALVVPLSGSLE